MDIETQKAMMVYKSQEINEAVCRLSNDAYKLVLLYISMIRPESDNPDDEKFIYLEDYCKITDENERTIKDKVYNLCYEIAENPLSFRKANGDFLIASWFSSAEWIDDEKKIALTSDKKIRPFLFDLKAKLDAIYNDGPETVEMQQGLSGRYIKYPYGRVSSLKEKYSIRFYEILRPAKKNGSIKIELDLLRQAIGAFKGRLEFKTSGELKESPKYLYPAFGGFNQNVLKPSMKELSEKTDIVVSFKPLKRGKKVISIKFFIKDNPDAEQFARQGSLFDESNTCQPPSPDPQPPAPKNPVAEIPQKYIDRIPAEQWDTTVGCKKTCLRILKDDSSNGGMEAVNFYTFWTAKKAKKMATKGKPMLAYGAWMHKAWERDDKATYDAEQAKKKAAVEARKKIAEEARAKEKEVDQERQGVEKAHKMNLQLVQNILDAEFEDFISFAGPGKYKQRKFDRWKKEYIKTKEVPYRLQIHFIDRMNDYLFEKNKQGNAEKNDRQKIKDTIEEFKKTATPKQRDLIDAVYNDAQLDIVMSIIEELQSK